MTVLRPRIFPLHVTCHTRAAASTSAPTLSLPHDEDILEAGIAGPTDVRHKLYEAGTLLNLFCDSLLCLMH